MRNFASILQLQSPMSRLVSEGGNRIEINNVLGSVHDCSVPSANLVQFVPPNSENYRFTKNPQKTGGAQSAQSFIARLCRNLVGWCIRARTTGAMSDGLKLQCVTTATFSSLLSCFVVLHFYSVYWQFNHFSSPYDPHNHFTAEKVGGACSHLGAI